jgi:hypothetical protein
MSQMPTDGPSEPETIKALGTKLMEAEYNREAAETKYEIAYEVLTGQPLDKSTTLVENFGLLIAARDGVLHLKLDIRPLHSGAWRPGLPAVVVSLRAKNITGNDPNVPDSAVDVLSTRAVARWACNSAASTVEAIIAKVPDSGSPVSFRRYLDPMARTFTTTPG